jgi:hypothetical protein
MSSGNQALTRCAFGSNLRTRGITSGLPVIPTKMATQVASIPTWRRHTTYMKDAIEQTGAVLMGRRTFEMGGPDSYVGNNEFQMPIFVVIHHPPSVAPKQDEHLTFTFVTDGMESAVAQAKAAARDKAVQVVGGVSIAQQPNSSCMRDSSTSFMSISCRYF